MSCVLEMMRRKSSLGVSLWMLLCVGISSACTEKERPPPLDEVIHPRGIPEERLPETTEDFVETPCEVRIAGYQTQCGVVMVPLDEGSEQSVEIALTRVFSSGERVEDEPIVYLEGGPGAAILARLSEVFLRFEPLIHNRDLIFFDQRGVGASTPRLDCENTEEDERASLRACFTRLSTETNLSATNTAASARDLDLVRRALGYERWNLLGSSYGTRLALTSMRDFPEGIRAVAFDGMVPLQADFVAGLGVHGQESFERIFMACQADPGCAEKYPDSMDQLRQVAAQLDETPAVLSNGIELTGTDLVRLFFSLSYVPSGVRQLPAWIDQAHQGNLELFQKFLESRGAVGITFGMHLSLHCAEEIPFSSRAIVEESDERVSPALRAGLSGRYYFDYCDDWPVAPAPDRENEPVKSAIPSLLLAGRFDPITPPSYSEWVASDLSSSQLFVLDNQSHGASFSKCGLSLVREFFGAPTRSVSATCLEQLQELEFTADRPSSSGAGGAIRFELSQPSEEDIEEVLREWRFSR